MSASITTEPPAEVYPRAPLRAVAIEVYFKPLLDALERFGRFQREHHTDFPEVYLPDKLDSPVLKRRRAATLMGADHDRAVAIGRDLVAVATFAYKGYADFCAWSIPLLENALAILDPSQIDRVRFVYENELQLDESGVQLSSWFRVDLPSANPDSGEVLRHVHLGWTDQWPTGSADVRLDYCSASMDDGELEFRIMAECDGPTSASSLHEVVDEAHRIARLTFEALITEEHRKLLRKPYDA